jgi:aminoglycoside phosphotransferase (APT) family kinase protein
MTEPIERPKTSTRDLAATHDALERWLEGKVGGDATIAELQAPPTNGMSSETILFEATWGGETTGLVGRIPPDPANKPVFPTYDIAGQFETMSLVRELTDVPVPEPLWFEADASLIGQPFFVMKRVEGLVPPDVMPYPFGDNWLYDATPEQQAKVQRSSVDVIARLHAIADPERHFGHLHEGVAGATPLRRHFQKELLDYYAWASEDTRSPLVERCIQWLQDNWPEDEGDTVLSWGDARIGNILYANFEPSAVLDWEMASLGPREIDVAWFQYLHLFFQDLAAGYGLAGMPGFMRRAEVLDQYEAATGHRCRDMDWYGMLAATRHGVVSLRTGIRGVQFGQAPMPDDVDDLIMHRTTLERMLEGTYWGDK